MHTTVVEFNALTDSVGTGAEYDDLLSVTRIGLIINKSPLTPLC